MTYMRQRVPYNHLGMLFIGWLLLCSDLADYLGLECEMNVLVVLVEDNNFYKDDRDKLKQFRRKRLNLELKNYATEQTTFTHVLARLNLL